MVAYNKFNAFVADLTLKVHNFSTDTLKVMLSNVAPVATNAVKADITEIAAGNGYSAGGSAATLVSNGQTGGLETLKLNNVTFTASGGTMATFRYAVLYNSTAASGNLIGWWDIGSGLSLPNGSQFQVQFDAVNGVLTIQ